MTKILACLDQSVYAKSVADHTTWAATRLSAGVELLQVLGRREGGAEDDRSGRIVAGARRQLLAKLADLDAERFRLIQEQAWLTLDETAQSMRASGIGEVNSSLRQGDLLECMSEREADAAMVVIGKRGEAADFATLHLGSNLERILRSAQRPVLVASREFQPIERAVLAFDGRPPALKAVNELAHSPLLDGVEVTLVAAGDPSAKMKDELAKAAQVLSRLGPTAKIEIDTASPIAAIPALVERIGAHMLIMGAYGHSRLRTLVLGSTTAEMIRKCLVPILVYR